MRGKPAASAKACCQRCKNLTGCHFWTYGTGSPRKGYAAPIDFTEGVF